MLSKNLKLAWRHLLKNRSFGLINLFGLAFGLAAAMAVLLYVQDELAYESFHERADNIYRVNLEATFDGQTMKLGAVPNATADLLKRKIPEVREVVRVFPHAFGQPASVQAGENTFVENRLYWVDSTLFKVFTLELTQGTQAEALHRGNTAIISQSTARRYFGKKNPVGQTIRVDNSRNLEVTGVFKDLPSHTHYPFSILAYFPSIRFGKPENFSWGNASFMTFALLHNEVAPTAVEKKIAEAMTSEIPKDRQWFSLQLKALRDVHLYSSGISFSRGETYGNIRQVRILIGLAVLLLLTACINYMNLATAKSQQRAKEVAVSKTLGAPFWRLAVQFYTETALLALMGIALSVVLLWGALPFFNQLSGKTLTTAFLGQPWFWLGAAGVWLFVTLVAGAYPAAYLSSFSPLSVLQQSFRPDTGAGRVRQSLVVLQFCISTVLIIGTVVLYQQLNFIADKELGYEPEQVVAIRITGAENQQQVDVLQKEIARLSPVFSTALAQSFPGNSESGRTIHRPAESGEGGASLATCRAYPEIFEVLDIQLLAGRPMKRRRETDTITQVVLNRSAIEYLGYTPKEAVGQPVEVELGAAVITGVVEDFHFGSLHQKIGNYAYHNGTSEYWQYLLVRLQSSGLMQTMSQLENTFDRVVPGAAFDYTFLDDYVAGLYANERRVARVVLVFAGLAVFVACLGLFALVAFTAEQRTKEIGIRKVLGASVQSLVALLSKDFMKLVAVSIFLAIPLAWWAATQWLNGFAYRIELNWWIFALPALAAVLIALITVSMQSIRAALTNPVDALRDE